MKVNINNKETETAAKSVAGLAEELQLPSTTSSLPVPTGAQRQWKRVTT